MPKLAANFSLSDQDGIIRSLADYRGRWLVLYFYPHDESLGCTAEACNFRDEYRIIAQFGNAEIVGINRGTIASHKRFAKRHHLNFPILSDRGHKVTNAYGAWRLDFAKARFLDKPFSTRRNTYIINPEGMIVKEYTAVNPNTHANQIISDLQALQSNKIGEVVV